MKKKGSKRVDFFVSNRMYNDVLRVAETTLDYEEDGKCSRAGLVLIMAFNEFRVHPKFMSNEVREKLILYANRHAGGNVEKAISMLIDKAERHTDDEGPTMQT